MNPEREPTFVRQVYHLEVGSIAFLNEVQDFDLSESVVRKIVGLTDKPKPIVYSNKGMIVDLTYEKPPDIDFPKLTTRDPFFTKREARFARSVKCAALYMVQAQAMNGQDIVVFLMVPSFKILQFVEQRASGDEFDLCAYGNRLEYESSHEPSENILRKMFYNYFFSPQVVHARFYPDWAKEKRETAARDRSVGPDDFLDFNDDDPLDEPFEDEGEG